MPVVQIRPVPIPNYSELVNDLAKEITDGKPPSSLASFPEAPLIVIESVRTTNREHITVIWDRFGEIEHSDRGRIILDAYEKAKGAAAALNVSIAMGLTRKEADRLGVLEKFNLPVEA